MAQGQPDATEDKLTATGEHPFYVSNRPQPGFVLARELQTGDELVTADGGTAIVTQIAAQDAIPGQHFTTYNLEVADFHTYFVGQQGVWVHNVGGTSCQRLFGLYERFRRGAQAANETPYETLVRMKAIAVSKKSNFRGKVWRLSLKEVNDELFAGAAKAASDPGHIPLNKMPSHKRLRSDFKGDMGTKPWTVDDLNSHHIVERRYQGRLGIPEAQWDDVPGFVVNTVEHTGAGGLAHRLKQVIGASNDPAVIIAGHRQVYLEKGLNNLWTVTEKWLIGKGYTIPPP